MLRQTIAIDIDDVLAANAEGFVAYSNEHWGTNLRPEDYHEHWSDIWQVDHDETDRRALVLHDSGAVDRYDPSLGADVVLKHLAERFDLIVVTSRREKYDAQTQAWLRSHFGDVFKSVHYSGIYDKGVTELAFAGTKGELLSSLGADWLIDDQPKHCVSAVEQGIGAILYGEYGWNTGVEMPEGMVRCKDWQAIKEFFDAR